MGAGGFQRKGETPDRSRVMLRFRYTCLRHQHLFVEAAKRGGCFDLAQMDEIRRKTLAWLSVRFPKLVFEHFTEESCLGCKLEESGADLGELEQVIAELARAFAPEQTAGGR